MDRQGYVAEQTVMIKADIHKVWEALTTHSIIKQYLFGTEVTSDWKKGSSIVYRGEWQGKPYEDKGVIVEIVQDRFLDTTYWSGMSGLPDTPENYKRVVYTLAMDAQGTKLTVSQDNNATEAEKNHSTENWKIVLNLMKDILEKS